jgi:leucine dehydrogenase
LAEAGADVMVSEVDADIAARAMEPFGTSVVPRRRIHDVEADRFAPCAIGAILGTETSPRLKVAIVAGAAATQLRDTGCTDVPRHRGIRYAADDVINAGEMIRVALERIGFDANRFSSKVQGISDTLRERFDAAERQGASTEAAARTIA